VGTPGQRGSRRREGYFRAPGPQRRANVAEAMETHRPKLPGFPIKMAMLERESTPLPPCGSVGCCTCNWSVENSPRCPGGAAGESIKRFAGGCAALAAYSGAALHNDSGHSMEYVRDSLREVVPSSVNRDAHCRDARSPLKDPASAW